MYAWNTDGYNTRYIYIYIYIYISIYNMYAWNIDGYNTRVRVRCFHTISNFKFMPSCMYICMHAWIHVCIHILTMRTFVNHRPISIADVMEPASGVRNLSWRHPTVCTSLCWLLFCVYIYVYTHCIYV